MPHEKRFEVINNSIEKLSSKRKIIDTVRISNDTYKRSMPWDDTRFQLTNPVVEPPFMNKVDHLNTVKFS